MKLISPLKHSLTHAKIIVVGLIIMILTKFIYELWRWVLINEIRPLHQMNSKFQFHKRPIKQRFDVFSPYFHWENTSQFRFQFPFSILILIRSSNSIIIYIYICMWKFWFWLLFQKFKHCNMRFGFDCLDLSINLLLISIIINNF